MIEIRKGRIKAGKVRSWEGEIRRGMKEVWRIDYDRKEKGDE